MTGRRARLAAGLVLVLVAGAALWRMGSSWTRRATLRVPSRLTLDDPTQDLSGRLERQAVVAETPEAPVREGALQPSPYLDGSGGYRHALIVPPPARLRFQVSVPADGWLTFAAGVQGATKRDTALGGVRFIVRVDGTERYARTVNPARTQYDRRWFDERLDLSSLAGHEATIELATEAERPGARLAGTPGWSEVRIVRETSQARQPARAGAPNVIVLLVDTLRADRLGCYGASPSPSPVLDRLAARGTVFEHAISQASWTMPAVASLFTGLLPWSHGMVGESREWGDTAVAENDSGGSFLADPLVTFAELAEASGISTVGAAANPIVSRGTNLAQGFESFFTPETRSRPSASSTRPSSS
jgi:hypothetical protein